MGGKKMKKILQKKGFEFDNYTNTWAKILEGKELMEYFANDADTLHRIEAGEIRAMYLQISPKEKHVQYILFERYPNSEDIANANIIFEDDYIGVMNWLQR